MPAFATVCFLLLAVTACKKTTAPASEAANQVNPTPTFSAEELKQQRLAWNLKTLVGAYQEIGNTDPKWDEPATNALAEFAALRSQSVTADEDATTIIRTNCDAAVQDGCDDPMIRYLYIKFSMSQTNTPQAFADAFCKTADDMQQSSYPPIRKFYASLRALQQVYYTYSTNADSAVIQKLANGFMGNLMEILKDKTTPPTEIYEACQECLKAYNGNKDAYEGCYQVIEAPLFANWSKESVAWLIKGFAYIDLGWFAQNTGQQDEESIKLSNGCYETAEKSLNQAWKLNPQDSHIAEKILILKTQQGKSRDEMELWFKRVMELDPSDYAACQTMLNYLMTQSQGSQDAILNFGRECVQSTNWCGYVPITLVDAHIAICNEYTNESEQADYWKQPDVWPDIKAAYDRFFELNPNATSIYKNYAWDAYHAEQWDAFIQLAPKVRPVDYNFFGGKDEFNKMVQLAKENAVKPK